MSETQNITTVRPGTIWERPTGKGPSREVVLLVTKQHFKKEETRMKGHVVMLSSSGNVNSISFKQLFRDYALVGMDANIARFSDLLRNRAEIPEYFEFVDWRKGLEEHAQAQTEDTLMDLRFSETDQPAIRAQQMHNRALVEAHLEAAEIKPHLVGDHSFLRAELIFSGTTPEAIRAVFCPSVLGSVEALRIGTETITVDTLLGVYPMYTQGPEEAELLYVAIFQEETGVTDSSNDATNGGVIDVEAEMELERLLTKGKENPEELEPINMGAPTGTSLDDPSVPTGTYKAPRGQQSAVAILDEAGLYTPEQKAAMDAAKESEEEHPTEQLLRKVAAEPTQTDVQDTLPANGE